MLFIQKYELGGETLFKIRCLKRLTKIHKIKLGLMPEYLEKMVPPTAGQEQI